MRRAITHFFKNRTAEDYVVALFGASFFLGVWYAFPMVNTVTDVWAFGGGVLRAIEAHSLLPGYGVAYGTLSFYQNYVAMIVALIAGYVAFGFDAETLKTALILNPFLSLLVPRIVSALTSVALLLVVYRFLKTRVPCMEWRLVLLMLSFGSVLITLLVRSGKMWMLSLFLIVISFIYLYRAVTEERAKGRLGWFSFTSILSAFLASANFLFAGLFLVNIPILLFVFWRTPSVWKRLIGMSVAGALVFLGFFLLNAGNIVEQASGFVLQFFDGGAQAGAHASLTLSQAFLVNARQAVEAFPLLLLLLLFVVWGGIRDKTLFTLAAFYSVLYLVAVSVVFRTDHGLALNVRHIAPLGFFLMFLLASCKKPARLIRLIFFVIASAVYCYTVVLLSTATTYNKAYDFVEKTYATADIRIDERVFELTLPMNNVSYALFATSSCGSTCVHVQALENDIPFMPVVVTKETDPALLSTLPSADLVILEEERETCELIASFTNGSGEAFDMDINLGRMLMPSFYTLTSLGKNLYVYDGKTCNEPS